MLIQEATNQFLQQTFIDRFYSLFLFALHLSNCLFIAADQVPLRSIFQQSKRVTQSIIYNSRYSLVIVPTKSTQLTNQTYGYYYNCIRCTHTYLYQTKIPAGFQQCCFEPKFSILTEFSILTKFRWCAIASPERIINIHTTLGNPQKYTVKIFFLNQKN